ncbi:sugar phosphate isomerase/epimerase family protein [Halioxenophilus aromaticivorans]|uniref:Sugar phosphate isomerase/epimerase n=1 Tax=Halioxenophilus aromaticivorans TaxID=1306992 RepID=A0AAV3U9S8_9ALTE
MQELSRRQWLKLAAGATAGACALASPLRLLAQSGNRGPSFGVQLYTARALMEKNVAKTLAKTAKTGFKEVELAGLFDNAPKEFKKMLDDAGLTAPSSHIPLQGFEKDFGKTLESALTLGNKYIVLPYIMPEQRQSFDIYKHVADLLNTCGEQAKQAGITVAYHNHDFEFEQLAEGQPMAFLLNNTDKDLVQFELDLYWASKVNQDPVAIFKQHPGRFPLWHVKDMAKDGSIANVGEGTIDFQRIFDAANVAGLRHGFIEHDSTKKPIATFKRGYKTLQTLQLPS